MLPSEYSYQCPQKSSYISGSVSYDITISNLLEFIYSIIYIYSGLFLNRIYEAKSMNKCQISRHEILF